MKNEPKIIHKGIFGTLGTHISNPCAYVESKKTEIRKNYPWAIKGFQTTVPSVPALSSILPSFFLLLQLFNVFSITEEKYGSMETINRIRVFLTIRFSKGLEVMAW